MTTFGKPLLQVCIENEESPFDYDIHITKKDQSIWQLQELMKILLVEYKCDPNIKNADKKYYLISCCIMHQKYAAAEMILRYSIDKLDINLQNYDGTTAFGIAFDDFIFTQDKDVYGLQLTKRVLRLMIDNYTTQIDMHKSQINYDD